MANKVETQTFELNGVGNYVVQEGKITRVVSVVGSVDLETAAKIYAHEGVRIFADAEAVIAALNKNA